MIDDYFLTDNGFAIRTDNDITTKYIYYFLLFNNTYLSSLYRGAA